MQFARQKRKELFIGALVIVLLLLSRPIYSFQGSHYCFDAYAKDGQCPEEVCQFGCSGGINYKGCKMNCIPKTCVLIEPENCPEERCQILKGCEEKDVCYPKFTEDPPECGETAYPGQAVECCEGFVKRCGLEFFDGTCDMKGVQSVYSVPICIPCGNGICNQFEDRCNCPEDCN